MNTAERGNVDHISDAEAATVIYAPGQDAALEARVHSHIATCGDCAMRLEALRAADRSVGELLSSLDVAAPTVSARAIVRTAQTSNRRLFTAPSRRAAAIIVAFMVVATAAAAAIPASPLHRLIVRALSGERGARSTTAPVAAQPTAATLPGVSFTPASSLDVVFERRGAGGVVHLRVVDGDQVSLSSPDGGATYRVSSDRITVNQSAPANFQLDIPRSLGELRILIGTERVFERRLGKRMSTDTLTVQLP